MECSLNVSVKPKADVIFILKFSVSKLILPPHNGKGVVQFRSKMILRDSKMIYF